MNKRIWLITLLIVSLGINLLIAGVVIGRMAFGGPPAAHLGWMMHELDDETRKTLRASFHEHRRASGNIRSELHDAQQRLHKIIGQVKFDEQAMIEALGEVRSASVNYQEFMHRQMVETLGQMKPEDRLKVYRFLSSHGEGHRPPRRRPPP